MRYGYCEIKCGDKKEECTKLCKEVRDYLNSFEVSQQEFLLPSGFIENFEKVIDFDEDSLHKTKGYWKNLVYKMYFIDGSSVADLLYHLNVSEKTIYRLINEIDKESINERL